jgi:hypothetical protein
MPEDRKKNDAHRQDGQPPIFKGQTIAWPLKMGPICCPETSTGNYHSTRRKITEERRAHLHRDASLKSRKNNWICPQVKTELRSRICDLNLVCHVECNPFVTPNKLAIYTYHNFLSVQMTDINWTFTILQQQRRQAVEAYRDWWNGLTAKTDRQTDWLTALI